MNTQNTNQNLSARPPIVAVLGHVDHGKTSLLDKIRETNVASREAGGITQSIGASSVTTKLGKKLTFIDTPGHAAFSKMRSRGATLADIVVLVVAADDGIKPQTLEALDHIKAAKVPFIVAFTKVDLPSSEVEIAKGQLEQHEVYFEGRGGDTPFVLVSSKTGEGIEDLLDVISLVAEVNEISADKNDKLEAVVIETSKDKRGLLASVVVRNGSIKVGMRVSSLGVTTKVRGIFDNLGKNQKEINPGEAGVVLGFAELPEVGSLVTDANGEEKQVDKVITAKNIEVKEGELAIFVKTKTAGSLEALLASLPAKTAVVGSGVGDVTESDVLYAKSAGADIYIFEAKVPSSVSKLAETERVKIKTFNIIYELIQSLEETIKGAEKQVLGQAEILAVFPYENKRVAGSKIVSGILRRGDEVSINRGPKLIGRVKIVSMRKQKLNIGEAKQGEELGIIFEPQLAFEVGDMLLSVGK